MAPSPGRSTDSPAGLFTTLTDDFRVVAQDIHRRGVKRAVGGTLESLEAFYLTDDTRRRLKGMRRVRRAFWRTVWLVRALLLKLTPARRIMLAAALVLLLFGFQGRVATSRAQITVRYSPVGMALVVAVLFLELKDKLVARDELEAGRQVQLALMPEENPAVPGWDIWLHTQPANDVGGDLVDHLALDHLAHAIALGDVAGKALPAALLSVKLQATIRALAPGFDRLGDLGAAVNRILFRDGLPARFASLVYLVIAAGSGQVRALNAGHMPPLVVRRGSVTTMERGGIVLGIMPDIAYSEQSVHLDLGDVLIVYSDGVSEAMNEAGDFFGDERLVAEAAKAANLPARAIGEHILTAVRAFVGHAPQNDDVSLIVLRRA
jgi:sigma-B regulation protein RsbU (phosphoserine phosphatase)